MGYGKGGNWGISTNHKAMDSKKQNDLPDTDRSQLIEKGFGMFETSLWHVSGLTRPRLYAVGRADSGSGIHQPGYKIAASSLGFCEAKLRSFPPTAKSGLGQVAKGVPVGHGPL